MNIIRPPDYKELTLATLPDHEVRAVSVTLQYGAKLTVQLAMAAEWRQKLYSCFASPVAMVTQTRHCGTFGDDVTRGHYIASFGIGKLFYRRLLCE